MIPQLAAAIHLIAEQNVSAGQKNPLSGGNYVPSVDEGYVSKID